MNSIPNKLTAIAVLTKKGAWEPIFLNAPNEEGQRVLVKALKQKFRNCFLHSRKKKYGSTTNRNLKKPKPIPMLILELTGPDSWETILLNAPNEEGQRILQRAWDRLNRPAQEN